MGKQIANSKVKILESITTGLHVKKKHPERLLSMNELKESLGYKETVDPSMTFAEAERILSSWDYHTLPDGDEIIKAISKTIITLRSCQEMGLSRED